MTPQSRRLQCHDIAIRRLPSGRFKCVGDGVPEYHLMDWTGCNCHYLTIPGQPVRGHETVEAALEWLFSRYATEAAAIQAVQQRQAQGTWYNGNGMISVDFEKRTAACHDNTHSHLRR